MLSLELQFCYFAIYFVGREGRKNPWNSWVPVVLATSVLFMFCTEPSWMIKYVWDKSVGNALSVIVGKVPVLHCYLFFTISFLERGIQSLILFPSSPVSPLHLMRDLYQGWSWQDELLILQLPWCGRSRGTNPTKSRSQLLLGLELWGVRSILWCFWLKLVWWDCFKLNVLKVSRKQWARSWGYGKSSSLPFLLSCTGTTV